MLAVLAMSILTGLGNAPAAARQGAAEPSVAARGGVRAVPAQVAYRQIVSFGDSLSDVGTYRPSPDAPGLRFTTKPGLVWTEVLASHVGLSVQPAVRVTLGPVAQGGSVQLADGLSYAQGGAMIDQAAPHTGVRQVPTPDGRSLEVQGPTSWPLARQIDTYLFQHRRFEPTQLVLIQGGANEFLQFFDARGRGAVAEEPGAWVQGRAAAMVAQVRRLLEHGASQVLYANLPDLGMTPLLLGSPMAAQASQLTRAFNDAVARGLAGTPVRIYDLQGLFDRVVAHPGDYALRNVSVPACTSRDPGRGGSSALRCTPDTLVEREADRRYLFADDVHPTARGHGLWGDGAAGFLNLPARSAAR